MKRYMEEREEWARESKRRREKMGKLVGVVKRWDKEKKGKEMRENEQEKEKKLDDIRESVKVEMVEREQMWRERGQGATYHKTCAMHLECQLICALECQLICALECQLICAYAHASLASLSGCNSNLQH